MNSLTTSTLAALEEMLQNAKRNPSSDCLPVYFEKIYVGNISRPLISAVEDLLKHGSFPHIQMDITRIILKNAPPAQLSDSLRALANGLHQLGLIPAWRNEEFAWYGSDGHEYFRVERAAFRTFGFRSQAAHINGFTSTGTLWLGRRSESKQIDPGKLDNLSAGGIAADETPWVCARRELWEEAGIPPEIAAGIQPAGRMEMRRPTPPLGFHAESLFIYDLLIPSNLLPTNHDGEVAGFIAVSHGEAAARILADEFTADAALVTADFILRRNIT